MSGKVELYSSLALFREAVMKSVTVDFYPVIKNSTDTEKHGRTENYIRTEEESGETPLKQR